MANPEHSQYCNCQCDELDKRVRELHREYLGNCTACITGGQYGANIYAVWPCPTIQILDAAND